MPEGPSVDRTREELARLRDDEPAEREERVETDRVREARERVEPDED